MCAPRLLTRGVLPMNGPWGIIRIDALSIRKASSSYDSHHYWLYDQFLISNQFVWLVHPVRSVQLCIICLAWVDLVIVVQLPVDSIHWSHLLLPDRDAPFHFRSPSSCWEFASNGCLISDWWYYWSRSIINLIRSIRLLLMIPLDQVDSILSIPAIRPIAFVQSILPIDSSNWFDSLSIRPIAFVQSIRPIDSSQLGWFRWTDVQSDPSRPANAIRSI